MSTANLDVFRGGTFVFEVNGTSFTLHKECVARVSKPLKAMMENGMKGSQQGLEVLQDTDELTFCRFVEYIYEGDYNPSKPIPIISAPPSEESDRECDPRAGEAEPPEDDWAPLHEGATHRNILDEATPEFPTRTSAAQESGDGLEIEPPVFKDMNEEHISNEPNWPDLDVEILTHIPLPTGSVFQPDGEWYQDHLQLFLSHAQLYVFADTYEVPDLQDLAATRLHNALSNFRYAPGSLTNIADLVSYAYEHTPDRTDEIDKLRTIVTHFCANNFRALRTSKTFLDLLSNGGQFVPDLIWRIGSDNEGTQNSKDRSDGDCLLAWSSTKKEKKKGGW